jgi:hypothetical protein
LEPRDVTLRARLAQVPQRHLSRALALAVLGAALVYVGHVLSRFPGAGGKVGGDYAYFMPLLLAGKYWIAENGVLAVPRFSPAFCGGLPFLANPQSIFYSVPQALAWLAGPLGTFMATTIAFAAAGSVGTYALMRRRFGSSAPAAVLSAVIFLCNGFLLHRMGAGHVTYHVFGLVPILCYLLLTPIGDPPGSPGILALRALAPMSLAGAILAYVVYAGAANIAVPMGIACLAVWLLHALARRPDHWFWPLGLGAAVLGAAAAAAKLAPAAVFVSHFPRVAAIALFDDPLELAHSLFVGLFLPELLPERVWAVGRHELDFGVGLVPLLLLYWAWRRYRRTPACRSLSRGTLAKLAALLLVLALPVALNLGGPEHAAWLKSLPYVGDNILLVRWFLIYVMPLTVGAGLALDYAVSEHAQRSVAALGGVVITVLPLALMTHGYEGLQPYDPAPAAAADAALARSGTVPTVTRIGRLGSSSGPNDGLFAGASSIPCYEPIFGYRLETFQGWRLTGPLSDGWHLRNPACYIYGSENGCAPAATFTEAERAEEAAFAAYRPFAYVVPRWQRWADRLSICGIAAILLGLGLGAAAGRIRARARVPSVDCEPIRAA